MSNIPASKEERDRRLGILEHAVKKWADKEISRLDNETAFLRAVLQGRGGVAEASTLNLNAASDIVAQEIDDYINFEG